MAKDFRVPLQVQGTIVHTDEQCLLYFLTTRLDISVGTLADCSSTTKHICNFVEIKHDLLHPPCNPLESAIVENRMPLYPKIDVQSMIPVLRNIVFCMNFVRVSSSSGKFKSRGFAKNDLSHFQGTATNDAISTALCSIRGRTLWKVVNLRLTIIKFWWFGICGNVWRGRLRQSSKIVVQLFFNDEYDMKNFVRLLCCYSAVMTHLACLTVFGCLKF